MQDLVARLIRCGFSRETAVYICRNYKKRKDIRGLELYVEEIEKEAEYQWEAEL